MKIKTAEIDSKMGGIVSFSTLDLCKVGDFFLFKKEENEFYFEVINIKTSSFSLEKTPYLSVTMRSVGHGQNKISSKSKIDIRSLLGLEVSLITDADLIKRIGEESRYL